MSRIKRTLPQEIRGIVTYRLEHYHLNKKELESFLGDMLPSNTAQLSAERKAHSGINRTTESIAMSFTDNLYLREIEKSVNAIDYIMGRLSAEDRKLVEKVYWRKSHSITGAGIELNMSQRTAYYHVDAILTALAMEMGLVPTS